jgi:Flp pilus assembly protein TadG
MADISSERGRPIDGHLGKERVIIDRGAAMVELAIILPVLVMLLVGIIEFGRAYNWQVSIQGAAREGARALALGESSDEVEAAVNGAAGAADVSGISQTSCPSGSSTAYATVVVEADFTFGIPFVDLGTKTLTASASMRCGL